MIGTAIKAMGRRGILRGAVGLGAAIGLGAPKSQQGNVYGGFVESPPVGGRSVAASSTLPDPPEWLEALNKGANEANIEHYSRPTFDNLDLDLAMLRSPSPAYKIVMQRARDERFRKRQQTLWDRFWAADKAWRRSLGL